MKKTVKTALSLAMLFLFSLQLSLTTFAADNTAPIGGLTPEEAQQSNEEIVEEILNDPTISDEAKASVLEKTAFVEQNANPALKGGRSDAMVLSCRPIMQEDAYKCAPATIQQTLSICPPSATESQTVIQNKVGKAPGLSAVLDYLNQRQSYNTYVRKRVYKSEDIETCIDWLYDHDGLVVFTFAATDKFWKYNTTGHFTNIAGYWNTETSCDYRRVDPYYYRCYVYVPPEKDEGQYWIDTKLAWRANTMLFGEGNNTIGY